MTFDFVSFSKVLVIPGRRADDNERLCAMESRLRLKRSPPLARLETGTAGSLGQRLPIEFIELQGHRRFWSIYSDKSFASAAP